MLLKKCFLPALTDEIKRRCYVGHNIDIDSHL